MQLDYSLSSAFNSLACQNMHYLFSVTAVTYIFTPPCYLFLPARCLNLICKVLGAGHILHMIVLGSSVLLQVR